MIALLLSAGIYLSCTTDAGVTRCSQITPSEYAELSKAKLTRMRLKDCVDRIPVLERSKYPGGYSKLLDDCLTEVERNYK